VCQVPDTPGIFFATGTGKVSLQREQARCRLGAKPRQVRSAAYDGQKLLQLRA
jgi:hypothetical protein